MVLRHASILMGALLCGAGCTAPPATDVPSDQPPAGADGPRPGDPAPVVVRAPAPDALWVQHAGDRYLDHSYGVAVDSDGNALWAVEFQGTANFGGGPVRSSGSYDGY